MTQGAAHAENLVAYVGATFTGSIVCDVGVTGVTGTFQAVKNGVVALEGALTVVDAPGGEVAWRFEAAEMTLEPGRYSYVVALEWPDATTRVVLTGNLEVRQGLL